jgi:AcrR family transcriptional regulator
LVATRGVVGASIESIAEHGNVSPVSVYRTFGDRETLLREAFKDVFPADVLAEIDLEAFPLEQAMLIIAKGVIRFAGTYPGLMALMLLPSSSERAELMTVHNVQRDLRARVTSLFEHHMATEAAPADDAPSRATAFLGLCLGASLLMHEIRPLDEQDVEPRARLVMRRFLKAVGVPQNDDTQTSRGKL